MVVSSMPSHTEKTGELPTSLPMGCTWATEWAACGLPMGILPCKLGCPLLPYMETVGSSVGSPLFPYMEVVGSSVGSGVGCPWAAHGILAMQIRLPTTTIYENSGQLSGQLSRQPTVSIYGSSWQLSGQRSGLPMEILPCKGLNMISNEIGPIYQRYTELKFIVKQ